MLSKLPINLEKIKKEDLDKEILRVGMVAELDAVSLYEQMAVMTDDENIKKVLLNIAKEEKITIDTAGKRLIPLPKNSMRKKVLNNKISCCKKPRPNPPHIADLAGLKYLKISFSTSITASVPLKFLIFSILKMDEIMLSFLKLFK